MDENHEVASKHSFLAHFNLGYKNEYEFENGIECFDFIKRENLWREFYLEKKVQSDLSEQSKVGYSATHQDGCSKKIVDYSSIEIKKYSENCNIRDQVTNTKNITDNPVKSNFKIITKNVACGDSFKTVFENLRKGNNLNQIELVFENCEDLITEDNERKTLEQPIQKFHCNICEQNFSTKLDRMKHVKIHLKTHICPFCVKSFKEKNELLNHCTLHLTKKSDQKQSSNLKYVQKPETLHCKICSKSFSTTYNLNRHLRDVHCRKGIFNKTNSKYFSNKTKSVELNGQGKDMQQERNRVNEKSIGKNETSSKHILEKTEPIKLNYRGEEAQHEENKENEKSINEKKCPICLKQFLTQDTVKKHMNILHKNQKNFTCRVCLKWFSTVYYLQRHLQDIHHTKGAFNETTSENYLKKANTVDLNTSEKEIQYQKNEVHVFKKKCPICFKHFQTHTTLERHIKIVHGNQKKFLCEICKKAFASNYHLNRHLTVHTGIKAYKCRVCLKLYKKNAHLTRHVHTHHPEEVVKCKICYKTCITDLHLSKHLKEHSECFKCPICYKKYPNKLKLLQHTLNAHIKNKKYD